MWGTESEPGLGASARAGFVPGCSDPIKDCLRGGRAGEDELAASHSPSRCCPKPLSPHTSGISGISQTGTSPSPSHGILPPRASNALSPALTRSLGRHTPPSKKLRECRSAPCQRDDNPGQGFFCQKPFSLMELETLGAVKLYPISLDRLHTPKIKTASGELGLSMLKAGRKGGFPVPRGRNLI